MEEQHYSNTLLGNSLVPGFLNDVLILNDVKHIKQTVSYVAYSDFG